MMRRAFWFPLLLGLASAGASLAAPLADVTGKWTLSGDYLGSPMHFGLELKQEGEKITGDFEGDKLEGTLVEGALKFLAKDTQGGSEDVVATLRGDILAGKMVLIDGENPEHPVTFQFTGKLPEARRAGPAQRIEFVPTTFQRHFSALTPPVLTIYPGDTLHTTTVDAGGSDEKGAPRVVGGNPETGPFYIATARPGDTLAVHIVHLRLNRDYAISDDGIVNRGMNAGLAVKMKDVGKSVRWHLDREHGIATPEKPGEHMAHYSIPLKPMLGCVATAPGGAGADPLAGDSGGYGGNMDFNEVVDGATVYLPVNTPGALLYFGDGHAAQGDGEMNGNALETSMDVELTVDVLTTKPLPTPRVENGEYLMAMGLSGSLDDAFKDATSTMAEWLMNDYKLTASEVAQVLGTSAEYKVSEAADRNAGLVLKIKKERLAPLLLPAPATPAPAAK